MGGEKFLVGLRGAKNFSVAFRIVFRVLFRVFQTVFRVKLNIFRGSFVLQACRLKSLLTFALFAQNAVAHVVSKKQASVNGSPRARWAAIC